MSKEAIRVYEGAEISVVANEEELEFCMKHPEVKYFCKGKVLGKVCNAQMIIVKGYEDYKGRKVSPHFVAKSSTPHILGCPNMQSSNHQIGYLIKDPMKLDMNSIMSKLSKVQQDKGGPSPDKGPEGGDNKDDDNNNENELYIPDFIEKKALNVDDVYNILNIIDEDEITGNGIPRKQLIADYRTIDSIRRKKYIFDGIALIIAGKCLNSIIREKFFGHNGKFSLTCQDPYISHNGKYAYYVVSFSDSVKSEDRMYFLHNIKDKDNLLLILSNWQLIENETEVIYTTTITNKKQIKIYKTLEKEKNVRKQYQNKL